MSAELCCERTSSNHQILPIIYLFHRRRIIMITNRIHLEHVTFTRNNQLSTTNPGLYYNGNKLSKTNENGLCTSVYHGWLTAFFGARVGTYAYAINRGPTYVQPVTTIIVHATGTFYLTPMLSRIQTSLPSSASFYQSNDNKIN